MLNLKTNFSITNSPNHPRIHRPVFPNKAKWRCLIPSDIAYLNKCKPKMLSAIELTHFEPREMSVQDIRKLSRALKDTKTASSLIIPKTDFYQQNHLQAIRHLLKMTKDWKRLNLDFNFLDVNHFNDQVFKGLLSSSKKLSSFQIKIAGQEEIINPIVNRISQESHRLPRLKKLHLNVDSSRNSANFREEDDSNASILTFKYPRSLSSLYLDFPKPEFVRPQLLPRFANAIKRCSLLTSFALSFLKKFYQDINSEMKIIASVSERIHQVYLRREFEVNQQAECLAYPQGFRHLRNISTLDLSIKFNYPFKGLSENYLDTLYPNLALLTDLKSLTLQLFGFRHPSQAFTHLKSLTKLEKLCFFYIQSLEVTYDPNFIKNLAKTLSHFHHLTYLQLQIVFPGFSSQSYTPLFTVLSQLVSLQTLSIHLAENSAKMTQRSITTLSHSIAKFNLTSLILKLGSALQSEPLFAWLSTIEFDSLFSVLLDFKHLSTLVLDLSTFALSPKESKSLWLAIKNLPKLSHFTLKLHQFNGFEYFADNPKEILKLTSFLLIFEEELGDREIGILATKLASFPPFLENVHLSFKLKEPMSNSGFTFLLLGLGNLPLSIKSFKLWILDYWRELNEKEMMSLFFEELVRLKKLETIDITFFNCPRSIHYDEAFKMKIINHQNLKHLEEFVWNEYRYL